MMDTTKENIEFFETVKKLSVEMQNRYAVYPLPVVMTSLAMVFAFQLYNREVELNHCLDIFESTVKDFMAANEHLKPAAKQ